VKAQNGNEKQPSTGIAVHYTLMTRYSCLSREAIFKGCKSFKGKLLIANNAFCIVQRATTQSKTGSFRDYGVAEAPPGFQAG
jgi:hypothetical protein